MRHDVQPMESAMLGTSASGGVHRSDRTVSAILDAAAHVLSDQGSSSSSMAAVAEVAGVSRATLYRYFPHREALLAALAAEALADGAARLAAAGLDHVPVEEAIERIVRAIVAVGDRYSVLVREQVKVDHEEAGRLLGEPMRTVFERGIEEGLLRADVPTDVLLELFGGALGAAIKLTQEGRLGLEDASAAAAAVFLTGARAQ